MGLKEKIYKNFKRIFLGFELYVLFLFLFWIFVVFMVYKEYFKRKDEVILPPWVGNEI